MDEIMLRLLLELPLRESVRHTHVCAPSLAGPRLAEAQADVVEGVIREVLDALDVTPDQHELGLVVAADALRRAAGEDRHYDPMVTADQHRPPSVPDQQS